MNPFYNTMIGDGEFAIWLDDVEAQVTFGVCGVLFLLFFAVLLVCVIMRLVSSTA